MNLVSTKLAGLCTFFFFFETEAKDLPHPLIKQKRVDRFISGEPAENRYNTHQCVTKNTTTLSTRSTWLPTQSTHTPSRRDATIEVAIECHRHHSSTSQRLRLHHQRAPNGTLATTTSKLMSAHAKQSTPSTSRSRQLRLQQ